MAHSALTAGVVVLALAWAFRGVLRGGVFAFEDVTAYFVPLYSALGRSLRHHELPFWELGAWAGQPLLGDPQVGAFYPPHWLNATVTPIRLYAWLALAHAGLAAAGMWRLVRTRGGSKEAAALAAIALSTGAFYILEVRHAMFGASTAWLVWSLWALERWAVDRRTSSLLWLALFSSLALLAGGWSLLYYGAAAAAVLTVSALWRRAPRERARELLRLCGAGALALALAAATLAPALLHARYSPRSLGLTYQEAASYAWPSWRYLVTLILPTFYGDDVRGTYMGAPDQWEVAGWGVGLVAVLLVPWALARRERRGERLALVFLCVAAMGLARGSGFFLHPLLYRVVPLFSALRCPARALYLYTLLVPLLAADGLDELRRRLPLRWTPLLALLPVVAAVELGYTFRAENPTSAVAATETRVPAIDTLRAHSGLGRAINDVHLPQSFHNAGLRWGFESAGGYSSVPIWRYLHFLYISNHGYVYPSPHLDRDLTAQGLWRFSSRLVDLLSVQWVLTDRAHPPDAGPGADHFHLVFAGPDDVDLWKNDRALPRGFVVYRQHVAPSDDQAARALADAAFLPDRVAIVTAPVAGVAEAAVDGSDGDQKDAPHLTPVSGFFRVGPTDVTVEVTAKAPGVLVLSEVSYPGWLAVVDGHDVPMLTVDYALRGVALTKGDHLVEMSYLDYPTAYGAAASFTALVLLLLLALRQRWLGRLVNDSPAEKST